MGDIVRRILTPLLVELRAHRPLSNRWFWRIEWPLEVNLGDKGAMRFGPPFRLFCARAFTATLAIALGRAQKDARWWEKVAMFVELVRPRSIELHAR